MGEDAWGEAWSQLNNALEAAKEHMTDDEIMQAVDDVLATESADDAERSLKPKRPGN